MTPLYLYALVDQRPRGELGKGIARCPLRAVRVGPAWVVVEQAAARDATPASLVAHDRVVRRIARSCRAVLPLRFASTAADRAALTTLLAPLGPAIPPAFARVRDAVQFTLRVTGKPAPSPAPTSRRHVGPGTRWLANRMARHRVPEIAALSEATRPFVREVRVERADAPQAGRLATVYHLVARENVAAWRAAARRAVPLLRDAKVTTTGPWPPYAFAELA
jgi:hypothetical protein